MSIGKLRLPGRDDQQVIAIIICIFLIGAGLYFWQRSITNNGFIDFEDIPSRRVEYLVDINVADWPELANLPGIGEKLAKQIVQHREQHGRFELPEQLMDIAGIGEAKLSNMRTHILISDASSQSSPNAPPNKAR